MRDYSKISTSIWNSRKFASVGDEARLLYLYLHTCPHVNSVGCFVLKEGYATADLGWASEPYRKGIETLSKAGLIGFDPLESLVRLVNFLEFTPFSNVNHAKGSIKIALALPDCKEKLLLLQDISRLRFADNDRNIAKGIETLSKPYRTTETQTETQTDKERVLSETSSDLVGEPCSMPPKANSNKAEGFDQFWEVWPNKNAKQSAEKAWKKLSLEDRRLACSAVRDGWYQKWRRSWPNASDILPSTFINGKRWNDQFGISGGASSRPTVGDRRDHPKTGRPQEFAGGHEGWLDVYK